MPRVQRGKVSATFEAREARIKGYSPLIIPKKMGSIQKIQVASLKDFLCCADFKSLTRRNARATAYFHADANAPAGSQRQQMPFTVTTHPVKKQIPKARRLLEFANIKIIFPLFMAKANASAIPNPSASCDAVHCGQRVLR